jgi:hypothetical protein
MIHDTKSCNLDVIYCSADISIIKSTVCSTRDLKAVFLKREVKIKIFGCFLSAQLQSRALVNIRVISRMLVKANKYHFS